MHEDYPCPGRASVPGFSVFVFVPLLKAPVFNRGRRDPPEPMLCFSLYSEGTELLPGSEYTHLTEMWDHQVCYLIKLLFFLVILKRPCLSVVSTSPLSFIWTPHHTPTYPYPP